MPVRCVVEHYLPLPVIRCCSDLRPLIVICTIPQYVSLLYPRLLFCSCCLIVPLFLVPRLCRLPPTPNVLVSQYRRWCLRWCGVDITVTITVAFDLVMPSPDVVPLPRFPVGYTVRSMPLPHSRTLFTHLPDVGLVARWCERTIPPTDGVPTFVVTLPRFPSSP